MKNINGNKKEKLKKILINNKFSESYIINNMLTKETLDKLINKITNSKAKVNVTTLTKKNYLTNNEQFLYLINNFIYIFKDEFYFLQNNLNYIIETLLQDEKNTKYLLCKKYIGNNKYTEYFSNNTKKLIIYGFYNNIKTLSKKSITIKNFSINNNIKLTKKTLSNKDLDNIYTLLKKLSLSNAKELNNYQLFENIDHYVKETLKNKKYNNKNIKNIIKQNYINNYEFMINNYETKKEAVNILLN